MSYNIKKSQQLLIEGVNIIQGKYPYYNKENLKDDFSKQVYSVEMVKDALENENFFKYFLNVLIFDALIGNSDRHHSNWGILLQLYNENQQYEVLGISGKASFAPLYDNGSSLCAYVEESEIDSLMKDKMRFEALINTKSKAIIGWNNVRPIRHFELVQNIKNTYYKQTIKIVQKICENITEQSIENILEKFETNIISDKRKKLVKLFILERRKRIVDIYGLGEQE